MNNIRSFANSYLYTRIPDYEKNIFEFVMKAERINKNSEAFSGIVEDVKRRQTTAVLSRVLARDDVILCINSKPLPASFKVFACKDVKNDRSVKVFIDLTGLISIKNGYFVINKIDVFCSYLMSAMTTIVYTKEPTKLTANSTLIQSGTSCFVALASHIFDYLRMPGYSENQNKICYILAMYYQCTLLGLNRNDNSVKNLAAKLSGIDTRSIAAVEFLYDDEDLVNIDTLIKGIAKTFKLSGLGTDTFIEKWTWIYGVGTLFGTELFTSFASMITDAYCGAYVNNQKTIEKCCGRDMVNFSTALIRTCDGVIDRGFRYESALDREIDKNNKTVTQESYSDSISKKKSRLYKGDIQNIDVVKAKYRTGINATHSLREASKLAESYMDVALDEFDEICKSGSKYSNFVGPVAETVWQNLTSKDAESVSNKLVKRINDLNKAIHENEENTKGVLDDELDDLKQALKSIDPENPVTTASDKVANIDEGVVDAVKQKAESIKEIKDQWKAATKGFQKGIWVERYLNESDKAKIMKYYKAMCDDDISYADYKRYFKAVCNMMRIPADKVIIETIQIKKSSKDKDEDVVAMRYSRGSAKVKIPDGVRLIHVSPAQDIHELIPSFRSKLKGRFLYPSKRVFFTVAKEIKPSKADLEGKKTTRYTPTDKIDYAYIDPTYPDVGSGSVYIETLKPIPVEKFERLMDKLFNKLKKGGKKEDDETGK